MSRRQNVQASATLVPAPGAHRVQLFHRRLAAPRVAQSQVTFSPAPVLSDVRRREPGENVTFARAQEEATM